MNDTKENIIIIPRPNYEPLHSAPHMNKFVHSYKITIENHSNESVQLISRHWIIVNAYGERREVEGLGVIGRQPTLGPGDSYSYDSWSPIDTEIGKMYGQYTMLRISDKQMFKVDIPVFALNASSVSN